MSPLRCLLLTAAAWPPAALGAVEYLRDIKPVLTAHCVSCHGAHQPKSELRLDTAAAARSGGTHGPALVPGDATGSLLFQVLTDAHPEVAAMPYRKPPLDAALVEQLRAWIDAGAEAPPDERPGVHIHWAFVPPQRPKPPPVRDAWWVRNPMDRFILERLEAAGIAPSPEAPRATLLRRVALDLTGVPPSAEALDAFLSDPRPDAYERAVDRLLASPHHGERWGRHWLDAARYADSNGYSIDAPRTLWPWRDWVVAALNRDQPYDEFVTDQLAGDLRTGATPSQRVATGFHRNTQINEEGGIDPEQFRIEAVLDRVNTTGSVLLGLTLACAQCHDHKFDPISQREYFALYAFFNDQEETALETGVPEAFAARDAVTAATRQLQEALEARAAIVSAGFADWEADLTPASRDALPLEVRNVLGLLPEHRTPAQREIALKGFLATDTEYAALQERLRAARRAAPVLPATLVLRERPEPRQSVVFIKGDFTVPARRWTPGSLRFFLRCLP